MGVGNHIHRIGFGRSDIPDYRMKWTREKVEAQYGHDILYKSEEGHTIWSCPGSGAFDLTFPSGRYEQHRTLKSAKASAEHPTLCL